MRYSSRKQLDNSHFPDALNTTYVSPRERKLLNDFRYIDDVEGVIVCEAGLIIDGLVLEDYYLLFLENSMTMISQRHRMTVFI